MDIQRLREAGKYCFNPTYSLFGVSSRGNYTLIIQSDSPEKIVDSFRDEALKGSHTGLEIRCNGMRVSA